LFKSDDLLQNIYECNDLFDGKTCRQQVWTIFFLFMILKHQRRQFFSETREIGSTQQGSATEEENNNKNFGVPPAPRSHLNRRASCSPSERRRSLQMQRQTAIVIEGERCSHESVSTKVNLFPNGGKDEETNNGGDEVDRTGFGSHFVPNQLTDQTKLLTSLLGTESPRRIRRSVNFSADS
jgi:hypothetical protein